ncbi:hypothetical protein QM012_006105 [Aureobasidium pullulans]|uniref:Uncharacterized protein n=1 Tax=Aureobasidium pullulans TaxID=5580 RepID=A0ABR0TRP4_AURPU
MDTTSPLDRMLRSTNLIAFFPALALLTPYGVVTSNAVPALGLIPAFFSAILGLPFSKKTHQRGQLIFYIDLVLAVFLISILIPFWALSAGMWEGGGVVMLGTYGTVPLMMDFCIHTFFALRHVFRTCRTFSLARTCPNCRTHIGAGIIPRIARVSAEKSRHSCESDALYRPLDATRYDDEEAPKYDDDAPKFDDEARISSEAGTLYRPSVDTLGSMETIVKLI